MLDVFDTGTAVFFKGNIKQTITDLGLRLLAEDFDDLPRRDVDPHQCCAAGNGKETA